MVDGVESGRKIKEAKTRLHHRKWQKLRVTYTACQQKKHAHIIFDMQF